MATYPKQTGPQGDKLQLLVDYVAGSSAFRARRELDTAREAEQFVHWPFVTFDPDNVPQAARPFAIVEHGEFQWLEIASDDGANFMTPNGTLKLTLTDNDRYPDAHKHSAADFQNWIDAVILDVRDQVANSTVFPVTQIKQSMPAMISAPTRPDRYWFAVYDLTWSPF